MKIISWLQEKYGKPFMDNRAHYLVLAGLYNAGMPIKLLNVSLVLYYTAIYAYTLRLCFQIETLDQSLILESIHYVFSFGFLFLFQVAFMMQEKLISQFIRALEEDRYQYGDTIDPETQSEIDRINKSSLNRKNLYANVLTFYYVGFGYGTILLFPVLAGKYWVDEPDDLILRRAPMAKYTPFFSRSGPGWYFSFFLDLMAVSEILALVCAADIPFICFSEDITKELQVISASVSNLYRRAGYVYERRYKQYAVTYESAEFRSCLVECIQQSLKHHIAVTKCSQAFDAAYGLPVLVFLLSGPMYICPSGVVMFLKTSSLMSKVEGAIHFAIGLQHNFYFAYYGERMSQLSWRIRDDAFYMGWEDAGSLLKPYLSMMQGYIQTRPVRITALGIIDYNFDTFTNIVRSAYTYLGILWRIMN